MLDQFEIQIQKGKTENYYFILMYHIPCNKYLLHSARECPKCYIKIPQEIMEKRSRLYNIYNKLLA